MKFSVVGFLGDQHAVEDLEQPLSQAPQRASVSHAFLTFLLVIGLAPGTGFAEAIRPQVYGVAQELVTGPTHSNLVELARLVRDWRGPGDTLQDLMTAIAVGIATHRG